MIFLGGYKRRRSIGNYVRGYHGIHPPFFYRHRPSVVRYTETTVDRADIEESYLL